MAFYALWLNIFLDLIINFIFGRYNSKEETLEQNITVF